MKILPLLAATLLSTVATAALAASANTSDGTRKSVSKNIKSSLFTGPYVGAYGGYDWSDADTATGFSPEIDGWDYGVFAGMRVDGLLDRVNGFGIGLNGAIEGFYGWSNADDRIGGVTVEKDDEWGVSFRPGLSFIDKSYTGGVVPYGILGYRNTKFEAFSGAVGGSERYNGFDLGIGTQLMNMDSAGIRAEYTHTWYASKNGIDPDSDNIRIGLSYQF